MRIQIVIDDVYLNKLEQLKEYTGRKQWQDLFSDAITVYNWAVEQRRNDRIVTSMSESDENYRELQMPALEYAAEHARQNAEPTQKMSHASGKTEMA
jgi:hypothetical protein